VRRKIASRRMGSPTAKLARHGVYVGRPTFLGNPFPLPERATTAQRVESISKYREWFKKRWNEEEGFKEKVIAFVGPSSVPLVCWCAPLPCHAEVIREFVDGEERKKARAERDRLLKGLSTQASACLDR
jgi:hypothetical protein